MIVTLRPDEIARLRAFSAARYKAHRARRGDPKVGRQNGLKLDYWGSLAEYAVAKALEVPFNFDVNGRTDGGWDLEVCGKKIDVKLSLIKGGHLMFKWPPSFKADIAILVEFLFPGDERDMKIIGCVSKKRFFEQAHVSARLNGAVALEQNKLSPMESFFDWKRAVEMQAA